MARRGRPVIKPSVKMTIWVLTELFRDRIGSAEERFSARQGCERLEKHLLTCFQGGRALPFDTIHRHYKEFNAIRRKKGGQTVANMADELLTAARANREILGWDASTWLTLIDPNRLTAHGHNVVLHTGE